MATFTYQSSRWQSLFLPQVCKQCRSRLASARGFSTTLSHNARNRQREAMFRWLNGPGAVFRDPLPGSTNYLSAYDSSGRLIRAVNGMPAQNAEKGEEKDEEGEVEEGERKAGNLARMSGSQSQELPKETEEDMAPFPGNKAFRSQPVLSEELKEVIWHLVMRKGVSVRKVSATYHVDMRRVGAVVRLKEVEKRWEQEGKRLATPYNRAVLAMLPQTPYRNPPVPHEQINDLPLHKSTSLQLYHPVAESRHFTRADAGQAFEKGLFPADERIQHPELIAIEGYRRSGRGGRLTEDNITVEWEKAEAADTAQATTKLAKKRSREDRTNTVYSGRWDFKFEDVKVDEFSVGKHVSGIGSRYGVPAQDRKKGQVKIPIRVG